MATWNTSVPAVGNQISADIPDIQENLDELHDVIEAITNGTLGTTTASDFKVDNIAAQAAQLKRAQFVYKDSDEIYVYAAAYYHVGTVSQIVYWNSSLTLDIGSPDVSSIYYIYLDDSAIVSAGTNLLTASEFLFSKTAPSWSDANHGWYSGDDMCIFAVRTDGSGNIVEFFHDGGDYIHLADSQTVKSIADIDTTWTDADISGYVPAFCTKVNLLAIMEVKTSDGQVQAKIRVNGQSGTTGQIIAELERIGTDQYIAVSCIAYLDSSQIFEIKLSRSGDDTLGFILNGFYLPGGI